MIRRQKVLTAIELQAILDSWSDGDSDGEDNFVQHADAVDIIITPPDVDILSDNEELDDNIQLLRDDPELPHEIAGQFEIQCVYDDSNEHLPSGCDGDTVNEPDFEQEEEDDTPVASTSSGRGRKSTLKSSKPPKRPRIEEGMKPKWSRSQNYQFTKIPFDDSATSHKALYEKIGDMNPVQLWEMFIDEEVLNMLVTSTNQYAATKNCPSFITSISEMKTFLGVLYITGYHTLPQIYSYRSNRESLGCALIKECISRDRFKRIKQFFHVCDNSALDMKNKFAKVAPLNDLLNKKFLQFGVFSHNLSIDEQMIAYYGRHSCKMFIKGKPIRFGYKYWCLASSEGYLYQLLPYAGASEQEDPGFGLGERVVLSLLSHLEARAKRTVTFDNFFTSHKLMTRLSNDGFFALGTVRDNRTNHAPLMNIKEMKKKPRGTSDFRFDMNNSILAVRWNDNAVVTLLSNFLSHTPMVRAKRYDRKQRKMVTIEQPYLVNEYNHLMGGVDLFDNAMNNYRIRIRGKKWYWPLITNAFDAAMVNAWKLHCFCRKYDKKPPMSQYEFRVEV
ncbi:piggyBac transposable element-derived protein 3-like [Rhagoletis pomonella]|uniref:piggyBac transposable element-derived protein 3-like n=1 Tax=Rhagoletis pomonella TaxID=28610 RepID=UPI00178164EA|nr:piggyBac transposable element-derived protein 3-like [Rhagoletis pomonella]